MEDLAPGIQEENALRAGGFNESEIGAWRMETAQKLQNAGFGAPEIDQYFGYKNPAMKLVKATLKQQQEKSKMATLNQEIQHRINLYHLADPGFAEGKSAEAPVSKEVLAEKARKRNARVHFRIRMEEKLPVGYTHRGQIPPILDTRTDSGFTPEQRLSIYSKHHKCAHGRAFN